MTIQVFDGLHLSGAGFLETMALKHNRIRIEVFGPSATPEVPPREVSRADEVVLVLARLIGYQIAREHFERGIARERKDRRSGKDSRFS